jgi:hypothetical protein
MLSRSACVWLQTAVYGMILTCSSISTEQLTIEDWFKALSSGFLPH